MTILASTSFLYTKEDTIWKWWRWISFYNLFTLLLFHFCFTGCPQYRNLIGLCEISVYVSGQQFVSEVVRLHIELPASYVVLVWTCCMLMQRQVGWKPRGEPTLRWSHVEDMPKTPWGCLMAHHALVWLPSECFYEINLRRSKTLDRKLSAISHKYAPLGAFHSSSSQFIPYLATS